MNKALWTIHQISLWTIVAESFWGLIICRWDIDIHVRILLFLLLHLDEILHKMLLRVDLIGNNLITDRTFSTRRTIRPVIKFIHLLSLSIKKELNLFLYTFIYAFFRKDLLQNWCPFLVICVTILEWVFTRRRSLQ